MTLDQVLSLVKQVRRNGSSWMATCPAHADKNPSLSIKVSGGKILLHCFGGCTVEAICSALGIKVCELFVQNGNHRNRNQDSEWGKPWPDGEPLGKPSAVYDYGDESDALLYQVGRFERIKDDKREKTFRQRQPDGKGGWIANINGVRQVPYCLAKVLKAKAVLVCEGEKDCESAEKLGIVATTNSGGAGSGQRSFPTCLRENGWQSFETQMKRAAATGQQWLLLFMAKLKC